MVPKVALAMLVQDLAKLIILLGGPEDKDRPKEGAIPLEVALNLLGISGKGLLPEGEPEESGEEDAALDWAVEALLLVEVEVALEERWR